MKIIGSINHYRVDPSGWIGSVVMFSFAFIALWKWQNTGFIFFALLALRDVAACWFLLTRNQSANTALGWQDALAYLSSGLPFLYFSDFTSGLNFAPTLASILSILGFTISTIALFELGKSFGVSPANRGHVKSGIYKIFKHPMYAGYLVAELGFVLLNSHNSILFLLSLLFYMSRAYLENKTLDI